VKNNRAITFKNISYYLSMKKTIKILQTVEGQGT
jgi:hypothetical protein